MLGRLYELHPDRDLYETLVAPGEDWEAAGLVHHYAMAAKPVIKKIQTLAESESTVWQPIIFDGLNTLLPEVQQIRSLGEILQLEFMDAYYRGENERAIEALRTICHLFGPQRKSLCWVEEMVRISGFSGAEKLILQSLQHDVWTPPQLDALRELMSVKFNWSERWRDVTRGELLLCYPEMSNEQKAQSLDPMLRFTRVAPSELEQLILHRQQIAMIDGAGTRRHAQLVADADQDYVDRAAAKWRPDRWIQFPAMKATWLANLVMTNHGSLARAFASAAREQDLTRCAIASKQFQTQFDRFPKTIAELAKVGFAADSSQTFALKFIEDGSAVKLQIMDGPRSDEPRTWATAVTIR